MPPDRTPRPELAERRRAAGYSRRSLAERIGCRQNTIRDWEQGRATPSLDYRRPLADALGISIAEVNRIIDCRPPGIASETLNGAGGLSLFVEAEQGALIEQVYDSDYLPALTQTRDYALALERTYHRRRADVEIDQLVDLRLNRASVLDREPDPLAFSARIPWYVLQRTKGSPAVMRAQLGHLLDLAERPNIDILVLPDHPDVVTVTESFVLLARGTDTPNLASTEGFKTSAIHEGANVAELADIYDQLTKGSLNSADSIEYIRRARETYRSS